MQNKTKTLVLALTAALMASGSVYAQKSEEDSILPDGPPSSDVLINELAGQTCTGSGGTNCTVAIPDNDTIVSSTMAVEQCQEIEDVNVGLDVDHNWVGDLVFSVTSPGGPTVVLLDRPGRSLIKPLGCSGDDILAMLDDDSPFPVDDECAAGVPTIHGIYSPEDPLFAFVGAGGNGTWVLDMLDADAIIEGNLNDWSLDLTCKYADLSITKSAPASAVAGTNIMYTVTVENDGPSGVQNAVVTDVLPAGVTYVSDTGGCVVNGQTLTCDLGAIPSPGDEQFTITATVDADVAPGSTLTNNASVASEVEDPVGNNDAASASTGITNSSPLSITKVMTPTVVAGSGTQACFLITVANAGPSDVTGVTITDNWTATPGVSCGSQNGCGPFTRNIPAGTNVQIQRCLNVGASAPVGNLINTATITGSDDPLDMLGDPANHTASATTAITRASNISLTKTDMSSADPIVAGSGAGNLKHVVSVTNNGVSDVTNLAIADALTVPAGVTADSITPSSGSFSAGTWTVSLASGASATLTLVGTVTLAAAEGAAVIVDTATVTGSGGGEVLSGDTSAVARSSIRWPAATVNVNKLYAGGPGPSVPVTLTCSSGSADGQGGAAAGSTDIAFTWKRFNQTSATSCTVTETVPAGYYQSQRTAGCDVAAMADGATYNCTLTNQETVARFHVTKDFSDGSTDDVEVTLACDTGLPLVQSLVIAGGDPTGVTFVVTDFVDGTMSCWVDEVTNTPGYDVDDSDCKWDDVNSIDSPFACVINNTAQDGTFTVNMEWDITNQGGDVINQETPVTIWCNAPIVPGNAGQGGYTYSATLGDGDSVSVKVSTLTGPASCSATQNQSQSGVESSGCEGNYTINAAGSASCTFTNSVFFEGIPTLNQYGLALLALLMLGVGMVGFRRFA